MKTLNQVLTISNVESVTLIHDTKENKLYECKYSYSYVECNTNSINHAFSTKAMLNGLLMFEQGDPRFELYIDHKCYTLQNQVDCVTIDLKADYWRLGIYGYGDEHHVTCRNDGDGLLVFESVTFINGIPTKVDAPIKCFKMYSDKGRLRFEPIYEDIVSLSYFYESVEQATLFHDYKSIGEDGAEKINKGRAAFMLPNEEQQKVLDELRLLFIKARAVGLGLMYNTSYCELHGYNNNTTNLDYDGCGEDSFAIDNDLRPFMPEHTKLPCSIIFDYPADSDYRAEEKK